MVLEKLLYFEIIWIFFFFMGSFRSKIIKGVEYYNVYSLYIDCVFKYFFFLR